MNKLTGLDEENSVYLLLLDFLVQEQAGPEEGGEGVAVTYHESIP